jgi:hypothetical protein
MNVLMTAPAQRDEVVFGVVAQSTPGRDVVNL